LLFQNRKLKDEDDAKMMTNERAGLHFERFFVPEGKTAEEMVEWGRRDAKIEGREGVVFEQKDVEFPKDWSDTAVAVVASKYFRGQMTSPERETSVKQMVGRVVGTIKRWGLEGNYFAGEKDADNWAEDLSYLLFKQYASFNSPVWFNIGVPGRKQQPSACFINSIEDTMESIMELAKTEAMIFKGGSGAGVNLSKLRGSKEQLSGGGYASGPISFMRGYDAFAGVIKSGGTTRRAAKMVILNADHPDIEDFIRSKQVEEHKAWALIEEGYDAGFNVPGGAYESVMFQNANHSVRVTDEFMRAVEHDKEWQTRAVADGHVMETVRARKLWDEIADSAWDCGDPGLQFDDVIQDWNCVPNTARINATNPCFTGDMLVHTNKGPLGFKELLERANKGEMFKVYTYDATHPEHPAETVSLTIPEAFMITGYKEVVKLRFDNEVEVRCTPNHRFWTQNRGYVQADELTAQDLVAAWSQAATALELKQALPAMVGSAATHDVRGLVESPRIDSVTRLRERMVDGVEMTYNLTEPKNHSYIVNGMVVANCSEFVFVDDSSCNLLSLNLMRFWSRQKGFRVEPYKRATDICLTAMEIVVGPADYPTPAITENSHKLRPLGIGYSSLGALLMANGLAYDSEAGREVAGAVTALLTGQAYAQSARMAAVKGPFEHYAKNAEAMLRVIGKHRAEAQGLRPAVRFEALTEAAKKSWDEASSLGQQFGYRNAQVSLLAPTGTIALMMDCDTTGVEPDLALVKYKRLVGGGNFKIVNQGVEEALRGLGYADSEVPAIVAYVHEHDTIEGAPYLKEEHLSVFDCAFKPLNGERSIAPMGHVRMLAAVQPFLSGSVSKTVNLPTNATREDIKDIYMQSWKLGLKCVALYRDGCKRSQPLSTKKEGAAEVKVVEKVLLKPARRRLLDTRKAITHKFDVQNHEGYLTVGMYEDGTPGELFIVMSKEGSTISGLMDGFATQTSLALQYGVPLGVMARKFTHMRFEPSGYTKNPEIPIAKSILDYLFRWLISEFGTTAEKEEAGIRVKEEDVMESDPPEMLAGLIEPESVAVHEVAQSPAQVQSHYEAGHGLGENHLGFQNDTDAPACSECGAIMVRGGTCYRCLNCGATAGCS
jgi:ribonucleotide reductase alpha subunit